jgi:hypothetical protein
LADFENVLNPVDGTALQLRYVHKPLDIRTDVDKRAMQIDARDAPRDFHTGFEILKASSIRLILLVAHETPSKIVDTIW